LARWQKARLFGFLPEARRTQVVRGLRTTIYETLCGQNWIRAEEAFVRAAEPNVELLQRSVTEKQYAGFAAVLRKDAPKVLANPASIPDWFAEAARRYGVCTDRKLSDFALKLAQMPASFVDDLEPDELEAGLREMRDHPAILRGARMLALIGDRRQPMAAS